MTDKEILQFLYDRLIYVHGEQSLYDYMINFKRIIDNGMEHEHDRWECEKCMDIWDEAYGKGCDDCY